MATFKPRPFIDVTRVHLSDLKQECGNGWCLRRHRWIAGCECGWRKVFKRRRDAWHMLWNWHLEDDHGGADD
jgi:hypothetical protein